LRPFDGGARPGGGATVLLGNPLQVVAPPDARLVTTTWGQAVAAAARTSSTQPWPVEEPVPAAVEEPITATWTSGRGVAALEQASEAAASAAASAAGPLTSTP
jgi:hypothetical protein